MKKSKKLSDAQICDLRRVALIIDREQRCFARLTEGNMPAWRIACMYRPTFECLVRDGYLEMLPEHNGQREVVLTDAGRMAIKTNGDCDDQ